MHHLHNRISAKRCIAPVAVGATGVGQTGKVIDRSGFGGVEFIVAYGSVTSTSAVFTVTLMEGDTTGALTSVADVDVVGHELFAGLDSGTRTSGTSKNVVKRVGYKGTRRYVQANVKSTATAATPISATAVLFNPSLMPTA